ncbi:TPA: tyrosine-type recombinase/integrase [Yersinia enterocolitica]
MAQRDNLYRRRSGIYVLRITVPARYRFLIGQREIHVSTSTTNLRQAKSVANGLLCAWNECLGGVTQMNQSTLEGSVAVTVNQGMVSIALLCKQFNVELEPVILHLLERNIPVFCLAEGHKGFFFEDYTELERDPDTGGFVLNDLLSRGNESLMCGYAALFHPRNALTELLLKGYAEETAFKTQASGGQAVWLVDFPGIRLEAQSLFVNKVRAESLRFLQKSSLSTMFAALPVFPAKTISQSKSPISPFCNPVYADMSVSNLLEAFLMYKNTGDIKLASEGKIRSRIEHFTEIMGDLPLGELEREVVKDYVAKMQNMPGNLYLMRRKYKISDTRKLIEKALADGQPVMSRDAIGRHIESLGSMLKWAKSERYLLGNPAENVLAQRRIMVREQDRRDLFTEEELIQIFSADWFRIGAGTPNQYGRYTSFRPFHYWLPLLALYLGGRINELCQLYLADIRMDKNGVAYVDFNLDTPDKMMDNEIREESDKSLKTVNAIRQVPIHPRLIELGLLRYVDALKVAGHDRLFPELKHNKIKGYRAAASKWFNENYFGRVLGFPRDGKKTFHSLRHTFINAVEAFESNERMIAQLVGHVRGSTTAMTTYRKDADVREQHGVISQLSYSLPEIALFDTDAGIKAANDARRRHKS